MAYVVVFNKKLQTKKYIYPLTLIGICLLQCVVWYVIDSTWVDVINLLCGVLIPLFWLENRKLKDFLLLPVVLLGTSYVNMFGAYFWSFALEIPRA